MGMAGRGSASVAKDQETGGEPEVATIGRCKILLEQADSGHMGPISHAFPRIHRLKGGQK